MFIGLTSTRIPSGVIFLGGASPQVAQLTSTPMNNFVDEMSRTLGTFLPSLIWAIVILIVGWIVATFAASIVKSILKRTSFDDRLASMVMGPNQTVPLQNWAGTLVYWVVMAFTLVAFLNALRLEVVSEPLNRFLQQIFQYLPRLGGAALLLGVAWATATIVRILVTQGLARLNLDDRLSQQLEGDRTPFLLNESIGNILYWFIFLLFVPLILSALNLTGLLAPIEALIDQFLQAIPRILTAGIILAAGWFIARLVRNIVTNLLQATQVDQLGERFGLAMPTATEGIALSKLAGTIVFVLILIPTVVAALNELDIQAISGPAISMLDRILAAVPQVIMAGVVLVVSYVVGRFVADLVTNLLRAAGFDNLLTILGLPELNTPLGAASLPLDAEGRPQTRIQGSSQSLSEIAGLITLVGIVLFGAVTATQILQFDALTEIVQSILRISARVLSGLVVFAIGLYFANLAFRLIQNMGGSQANILAQAARIAIITLVGAMGLQQMGVATDIVNLAFGLLLGAVAVAIAIAFGLGGRDIAAEQIRAWLNTFKR